MIIKRVTLLLLVVLGYMMLAGQTTILSQNFSVYDAISADGSTDIGSTLDTDLDPDGWTGSKVYKSTGRLKMGSSSGQGIITIPTVNISANSGAATFSFSLLQYGSDAGKYVQVLHAPDGTTFTQVGADIAIPASVLVINVPITGGTASSKIRIQAKVASSNRFYLDNILLTQSAATGLATVTTTAISGITTSAAVSGGNVTSDGGSSVTARGVCWSTSANPTISGSKTTDGSGTGTFTSNITGLSAATLYYVRAYATNTTGTAYGDELSFTTSGSSPPSAPVANAASSVTYNSFLASWGAVSGATLYYLDVSTVNTFATYVSGYNNLSVASTSQTVSGLANSTTYFYRVRAYNSNGTSASSNVISVTTSASDPFNGYYNPVSGLTGTALKTGLHDLIDSNTYSSYDGAKTFLFQELDNNSGVVRCVYTGRDYTINSSYNGSTDPNTEHTYAQSWFGTSEESIKKADVHHLFVTNSSVNSSRGNLPFDVVTTTTSTFPVYNGYVSKRGTNSTGDDVFEPADQHKGNLARALLYFSVRYNMTLSQGGVDMLETLITWHNADAVDAAELARNTAVYAHQGNRNPFVDHPEYVAQIWGGAAATTLVNFSPASAVVNESAGTVTLTVQITNPSATAATSAQIALSSGTATDIANYTTQSITFPAGSSTAKTITVSVTDDSILEGTETLSFSLINVSGGSSAAAGNYAGFNLEIIDNDIPTVTATAASAIGYTGFTANWQAASGITDYELDLSTNLSFTTFVTGFENLPVTGTSLAITGLTQGTTYYYRVRAVYNESYGAYSAPITQATDAIVYLSDPVAIDATAVSHEGFTARWNSVSGATGYYIDVFTGSSALASDLFISEYVEGTSNNKYVEIFNGTGATVDLSAYSLRIYPNGATTPNATAALTGSLPNGSCVVLKNSSAALTLPGGVTAITNGAVNFNGDDAFALCKGAAYDYVDIFGSVGYDPGTNWSSGTLTTLDATLRRKTTVNSGLTTNPATSFPTLGTEWDMFATDTASGLGSHSISAASPLAGYSNLPVSQNLVRISGLTPETQYSYRVRAYNAGDTSENSNLISVTTTAVNTGTGANTAISGAATLVEVPALPSYANNTVLIDPVASTSDDYAVSVSTIDQGIKYSVSCSNNSALNGTYTIHHSGLNATPSSVICTLGGVPHAVDSFSGNSLQTVVTISGLAKSSRGVLEISLTGDQTLPVELSSFTATINAENYINLQWISQSETGVLGYYVLRGENPVLEQATITSPLISGTNTSQQQSYVYTDRELTGAGEYYYWLQNLDINGENGYHGPISIVYNGINDPGTPQVTYTTGIHGIFPNPFSQGTFLSYELERDAAVSIRVFDGRGRLVRELQPSGLTRGAHQLWWDGRDKGGNDCSSGIYLIRMLSDAKVSNAKVLILK